MAKILAHQSLTLTEQGESNPLGTRLLEHLFTKFPIGGEGIYSAEEYLNDIQKTFSKNPAERFQWLDQFTRSNCYEHFHPVNEDERVILIWGSGEAHFASQYISPRETPYHKVIWDRHSDDIEVSMQEAMMGIAIPRPGAWITCEVKANKNLHHYHIINRKTVPYEHKGQTIHASVDLDVVRGFPARHDWQYDKMGRKRPFDHRGMTLDELLESITQVLENNTIIRFDVGGLHLPTEKELKNKNYSLPSVLNPLTNPEAMAFAIECYEKILRLACEHMKK